MHIKSIETVSGVTRVIIGDNPDYRLPLRSGKTIIITDSNVDSLYRSRFPEGDVIIINPGEESKQLAVAEEVIAKMLKIGVNRKWFLLGIGGGVVCDVAGFIASIYMRGIDFGFISTTLLSQVDASIGGKNGVNIGAVKNVAGIFNQPEFVVCDTSMLKTLSVFEYQSGLGELIKSSIIGGESLFSIVENKCDLLRSRDKVLLPEVVSAAIDVKRSLVESDFKESGPRKILNLGHTLGHALELTNRMSHGAAVAAGIAFSIDLSLNKGFLNPADHKRIQLILLSYELLSPDVLISAQTVGMIGNDKKRDGSEIDFVFVDSVGKVTPRAIAIEEVQRFAQKWRPGV